MNSDADMSMSGAHTIRLVASIGVRESAALKQQLLPLLESRTAVLIDVTDVQRVDTAGLQLLFAFGRDRLANGLSTNWLGDSPALRNAAVTLNLNVGAPGARASV